MAKTFDMVLLNGALVNHDGESRRDIGVTGGKIAEIGDLSRADAGRADRLRGAAHSPRSDRHAGAFSRARRDA